MSHANERAGLLWVLAGFCTLSIGDAIVKGMAGLWPPTAMAASMDSDGMIFRPFAAMNARSTTAGLGRSPTASNAAYSAR